MRAISSTFSVSRTRDVGGSTGQRRRRLLERRHDLAARGSPAHRRAGASRASRARAHRSSPPPRPFAASSPSWASASSRVRGELRRNRPARRTRFAGGQVVADQKNERTNVFARGDDVGVEASIAARHHGERVEELQGLRAARFHVPYDGRIDGLNVFISVGNLKESKGSLDGLATLVRQEAEQERSAARRVLRVAEGDFERRNSQGLDEVSSNLRLDPGAIHERASCSVTKRPRPRSAL